MKKIIYQVMTRLWGNGRMSSLDNTSLAGLKDFGIDYIWLTGIPRHASGKDFVKGDPGCPYSISDWRDVNPYLADNPEMRIREFSDLVARIHNAGMKVLIDCIPNHVSCDYQGPLKHFEWHDADWTDTLKIDWSDPGTVTEMVSILLFWMGLGVDGFRCDMVELVPSHCLGAVIDSIKAIYPGSLFVAEVYEKNNYRRYLEEAHFDLLYDKSGTYDTLRELREHPDRSAEGLTWNWQWLSDMQPRMLNFLENHDEQRVPYWAGDPFLPGLAYSMLFNTASFMIYFGEEVGEDAHFSQNGRTSIFNWESNPRLEKLPHLYSGEEVLSDSETATFSHFRELLRLSHEEAFSCGNVWDLCYLHGEGFNVRRHFAFLRYTDNGMYLVFCNFSSSAATVHLKFPDELRHLFKGNLPEISVPSLDYKVLNLSDSI